MEVLHYLRAEDNAAAKAQSITLSPAPTGVTGTDPYPVSNLKDLPIAKIWKSRGTNKLHDHTITLDLGSAQNVDLVALVNHNLKGVPPIRVETAGSSAFTNPESFASFAAQPRNAWHLATDPVRKQHWRIRLPQGSTKLRETEFRVGYLMLGKCGRAPQQFQAGWTRSPRKVIRRSDSDIGTPLVGRVISSGYRLAFEWLLDDTDTDNWEDVLNSFQGSPVLLVPSPAKRHAFFARFESFTEPWQTVVALDRGPNQISASFITDNEGSDLGT